MQSALHAKAKDEPGYRYYLLYDKVYRADVLEFAYRCCEANKGAAGVDGQRFEDIEAYGEGRWLGELADRLRSKTYEPKAVKRVWIPKPNGIKLRPLGVVTHAIRLKLLKIGAVVTLSVRRVRLAMSEACASQPEFIAAYHALNAAAR